MLFFLLFKMNFFKTKSKYYNNKKFYKIKWKDDTVLIKFYWAVKYKLYAFVLTS